MTSLFHLCAFVSLSDLILVLLAIRLTNFYLREKKSMLSCKRVKGAHTYHVLAKEIEAINWDYGIETKIVSITNNGTNFVKILQ